MSRKTKHADPRTAGLLELQDELGLTDKQRKFVEALAVDPERNQTKAALAAGCAKKSASVAATRMLKLAKVQRYFNALTATSRDQRAADTRDAIAGLTEVLTTLTDHMRARMGNFMSPGIQGGYYVNVEAIRDAPPGVIVSLKHDAAGDIELKLVDGKDAAKTLLAHYTDKPLGGGGNLTVNAVITNLPGPMVTALFRAMALASGRGPAGLLPQNAGPSA